MTSHGGEHPGTVAQRPLGGSSSLARLAATAPNQPPLPPPPREERALLQPSDLAHPLAHAPPEATETGAKSFLLRLRTVLDRPTFGQASVPSPLFLLLPSLTPLKSFKSC